MYTRNGVQINCDCSSSIPVNVNTENISHIDGFDLYIVRGDSIDIDIPLYKGDETYNLDQGEVLHSQCRMVGNDEFVVWDKTMTSADQVLHILPTDTEDLDPDYKYVWDIQIESESKVETVIPARSSVFIIPDATYRSDGQQG